MPTVKEFSTFDGCSTAPLRPLTNQILEVLLTTINTAEEPSLVSCADIPLLEVVGGSTIPMLQPAARKSLQHVIAHRNEPLKLVHAYRTIAQQFVLREWKLQNRCVAKAARPGTSDHERGLAIDIRDHEGWISTFISHGWTEVQGDPGHFKFNGDDVNPNVINESVRAFQILWNRNNPDDLIDEDGVYGEEQTGPALRRSPIAGFPNVS